MIWCYGRQGSVTGSDLLGQRIYGPALGYEDANDDARLAAGPMHKLLLGRDPVTGEALASWWMGRLRYGIRNNKYPAATDPTMAPP